MALIAGLMNALQIYIEQAYRDAVAHGYTARIRASIQRVDPVMSGDSSAKAGLKVSLVAAPEARAFELGSGIHDQRGAHLIPIAAKNVQNLVFFWANRRKWFVGPALPYGHPGVQAEPTMGPAMVDNLPLLRRELGATVKQEIHSILVENSVGNRVK